MSNFRQLTQPERNEIKSRLQAKAADIIEAHPITLFEWCVGVGKSRAAIRGAERIKPGGNHLILSSERVHIDNWNEEIANCGTTEQFEIRTYVSAAKASLEYYDTITLDEAHNLTPKRIEEIGRLKYGRLILLSAEVPKKKKMLIYQSLGKFFHWHISLKQAIESGLIPTPRVTVLNIYAQNEEVKYIYKLRNNKQREDLVVDYQDYRKYLGVKKNIHIRCTEYQYLLLLQEQMEYLQKQYFQTREKWAENQWLRKGSERKRFIAKLKTDYLKQVVDKLDGKRFICFTGSISQCEEMSSDKREVAHSKQLTSASEQLKMFNDGEINRLFVVNIAREGVNLANLDAGIIAQADGSFLMTYQKLGRVVRGVEPRIYVLRLMHTKDEKYVNNLYEALPNELIRELTINQFLNGD